MSKTHLSLRFRTLDKNEPKFTEIHFNQEARVVFLFGRRAIGKTKLLSHLYGLNCTSNCCELIIEKEGVEEKINAEQRCRVIGFVTNMCPLLSSLSLEENLSILDPLNMEKADYLFIFWQLDRTKHIDTLTRLEVLQFYIIRSIVYHNPKYVFIDSMIENIDFSAVFQIIQDLKHIGDSFDIKFVITAKDPIKLPEIQNLTTHVLFQENETINMITISKISKLKINECLKYDLTICCNFKSVTSELKHDFQGQVLSQYSNCTYVRINNKNIMLYGKVNIKDDKCYLL